MARTQRRAGAWPEHLTERLGQASTSLRSVGATLASGLKAGYESLTADSSDKELVTVVTFATLEYGTGHQHATRKVLLLGYQTGFQVWDLEESRLIRELASRRDGAVRCLEAVPLPSRASQANSLWATSRPCIAIAPLHACNSPQDAHAELEYMSAHKPQWQVQLYSLQSHTYFHTLTVSSRVLGLRCSCRVLCVALDSQVLGYDIGSMQLVFSVMTHPAPGSSAVGGSEGERPLSVPLALGPRWLAYAANQGVQAANGCALAQSPGGTHTASGGACNGKINTKYEAVSSIAKNAAKLSGQQLRSFGQVSFKFLSEQYDTWRGGTQPGSCPAGNETAASTSRTSSTPPGLSESSGTVMVRDVVSRAVIAHFRAHSSPLQILEFDPSGTLLVTASVQGHSIHIFQICPPTGGRGGVGTSGMSSIGSAVHLFRLSRGMTPAVIQGVSFASSGEWLTVSSARGTGHLFHLVLPSSASQLDGLPPHLVAANRAGSRFAGEDGRLRHTHAPVDQRAIGRVRGGGNGFTNGSIPGSAAASAAVSLYSGTAGLPAVASAFLPRKADDAHAYSPTNGDVDDVMMVSMDGLLTRHRLRFMPHSQNGTRPKSGLYGSTPDSVISVERAQEAGSEVAVEADAQWDVCRRRTWPEREETIDHGPEAVTPAPLTPEQERQQWMAAAETWVPGSMQSRAGHASVPLWADDQFRILEMRTGQHATHRGPASLSGNESQAGSVLPSDTRPVQDGALRDMRLPANLLQVEEVPTVRRGAVSSASHKGSQWTAPSLTSHMRSGSLGSDISSHLSRGTLAGLSTTPSSGVRDVSAVEIGDGPRQARGSVQAGSSRVSGDLERM